MVGRLRLAVRNGSCVAADLYRYRSPQVIGPSLRRSPEADHSPSTRSSTLASSSRSPRGNGFRTSPTGCGAMPQRSGASVAARSSDAPERLPSRNGCSRSRPSLASWHWTWLGDPSGPCGVTPSYYQKSRDQGGTAHFFPGGLENGVREGISSPGGASRVHAVTPQVERRPSSAARRA